MSANELLGMVRRAFPGQGNQGLRTEVYRVLAAPVDEVWPVPLASRVRGLAHSIALSGNGRASLEQLAVRLEVAQ